MRKCEMCGRILKAGESNYCPCCGAKIDRGTKILGAGMIGGLLCGALTLMLKIVKGKITGNPN